MKTTQTDASIRVTASAGQPVPARDEAGGEHGDRQHDRSEQPAARADDAHERQERGEHRDQDADRQCQVGAAACRTLIGGHD